MSNSFKPDNAGPLKTRLRVLTWNLWWQFGPWQDRAIAIEATLKTTDADVIALQEVWGDAAENYAGNLAEKLGYHLYHADCMTMNGVGFGNAILSRWPIQKTKKILLSGAEETGETRNALYALIDGPRGPIDFFCTHLNWRYEQSHIRQVQVREVAALVKANTAGKMPPILCGDFNAEPMSEEIRMLTGLTTAAAKGVAFHDAWGVAGRGAGLTWDNRNAFVAAEFEPDRRIDYIFAGHPKARGRGHVTDVEIIGNAPLAGVWPSDHFGVMAKLRY